MLVGPVLWRCAETASLGAGVGRRISPRSLFMLAVLGLLGSPDLETAGLSQAGAHGATGAGGTEAHDRQRESGFHRRSSSSAGLFAGPEVVAGRGKRLTPDKLVEIAAIEIPRDRDIVLYCTCPSEATAAKMALNLRKLGIYRVRPLRGGFDMWKAKGFPLEEVAMPAAMSA